MNTHKTYTVEEAIQKMEHYCAYQERCHKEVVEKLYKMRMIPEAIDHIVVHLVTANFLNETRFALAFARGRFTIKKWGKNRIVSELKMRNISEYNRRLALKEIPEEAYLATLEALAEKRYKQLEKEKDFYKKRRKFMDYLLYRGWEAELIYEQMDHLFRS